MQGQFTLRPEQADILDRGLMWGGPPLVWSSPTGSGKTWLSRFALRKALDQGLRAVMLVPLRAIATEVATRLRSDPLFADAKVARLTGELAEDDGAPPMPAQAWPLAVRLWPGRWFRWAIRPASRRSRSRTAALRR